MKEVREIHFKILTFKNKRIGNSTDRYYGHWNWKIGNRYNSKYQIEKYSNSKYSN